MRKVSQRLFKFGSKLWNLQGSLNVPSELYVFVGSPGPQAAASVTVTFADGQTATKQTDTSGVTFFPFLLKGVVGVAVSLAGYTVSSASIIAGNATLVSSSSTGAVVNLQGSAELRLVMGQSGMLYYGGTYSGNADTSNIIQLNVNAPKILLVTSRTGGSENGPTMALFLFDWTAAAVYMAAALQGTSFDSATLVQVVNTSPPAWLGSGALFPTLQSIDVGVLMTVYSYLQNYANRYGVPYNFMVLA